MRARALFVALAVTLAGCSGSPSAPTPTTPPPALNLAGTWTGQLTLTDNASGQDFAYNVRATLTQTDRVFAGTWANIAPGATMNGAIDGTLTGTGNAISATVTWDVPAAGNTAVRCTGISPTAGTATGTAITMTADAIQSFTCDGGARNIRWQLSR